MNALESLRYIYPELALLIFASVILILGLFFKKANLLGVLGLLGIALCALFLLKGPKAASPIFSNLLLNDRLAVFFKAVSLISSFVVLLISMGYKAFAAEDMGEYYFLLLTATIAMLLAVSSNNLLMIYISLEMLSLISYVLVGFLKRDPLSSEGALKYFLFGTFSTGIMLYGISFIYGLFGTTDLAAISVALSRGGTNNFVVLMALILILAGIGFKCALVPFHMWVPDAYEGAPTPVAAFISVGGKAVGFAILLRVFLKSFIILSPAWLNLFTLICILTMTVGNIIALSQTNIKRMLGYSSIAQAGYILIGFTAGTALGAKAVLFYIIAYAFMNLGAFGCVVLISNCIKSDEIEHYAGFYRRDAPTALILSIFLLSLAGIPPLAGFLGKFFVFASAVEARFILIAVAAVINSIIALYYYLKVIKYMYLEEPKTEESGPKLVALQAAVIIALLGVLLAGIWPQPFLDWVRP